MPGITLDAGALIAAERGDPRIAALIAEANAAGLDIAIPAGVIGQVWRGAPRQTRVARILRLQIVDEVPLDGVIARAAGVLCGRVGTSDVIDASVALCARDRGHAVVTSDPDDLARLDPGLRLVAL
ncbi:MAG: PIN domain-containing protein [Solirubrobacteraceae bacterium]|nr:PIN domain-containing protein [Solirubrobacteraceae bacterium]